MMDPNTDNISSNRALVLEGGAMRGVFTCGVLDWLLDNDIHFPYTIGVSAGACNGVSYISHQRGRARYSNIELLQKYKYIGFKHFLKKHNFLDFDLLFDDFPNRIAPFDFDTYINAGKRFEIVVSSCITGQAIYCEEYADHDRLLSILRASSSMPLFSPIVEVDRQPMLDGGVCDPIPVLRSITCGYDKQLVVLTRNKGYRKKEHSLTLPSWVYRKYPQMRQAINQRNRIYNAQLDLVEQLESDGKAIVIRPIEPITIGRLEKDISKLIYFYEHGYECASMYLNMFIGK